MPRLAPLKLEDIRSQFEDLFGPHIEFNGYIPNSYLVMSRRPPLLRAIAHLSNVVMFDETTISHQLKWMIANTVSSAVECRYCQAHTAANAEFAKLPVEKIEALWNFEADSQFTEAERAALVVARAAGHIPSQVTDEMFVELKRHYSDEQIVDIVSVISLFGWFNRWNDTFANELEVIPLRFAEEHLSDDKHGWTVGNHAAAIAAE